MKPLIPACLVAAALLSTPKAFGAQDFGPKSRAGRAPGAGSAAQFSGEIMEIREGSLAIRPWNPDLPRRVEVVLPAGVRCLRQTEGRPRDLKLGELVTVVPAEPKLPKDSLLGKPAKQQPAKPEDPQKPPRVSAVLRFWRIEGATPPPEDHELTGVLFNAAQPFFRGPRRGGAVHPTKQAHVVTGILIELKPLTVGTRKHRPFDLPGDALVINHEKMSPANLKRGQTVFILAATPPVAGEPVEAKLIVRGPKPDLNPKRKRQFILREDGREDR